MYAQWGHFDQFDAWLDRIADLHTGKRQDLSPDLEARWLSCFIGAMLWVQPAHPALPRHLNRVIELLKDIENVNTIISVAVLPIIYAVGRARSAVRKPFSIVFEIQSNVGSIHLWQKSRGLYRPRSWRFSTEGMPKDTSWPSVA